MIETSAPRKFSVHMRLNYARLPPQARYVLLALDNLILIKFKHINVETKNATSKHKLASAFIALSNRYWQSQTLQVMIGSQRHSRGIGCKHHKRRPSFLHTLIELDDSCGSLEVPGEATGWC